MHTVRKDSARTAVGTLALAMLVGLAGARADPASDLQADQRLLSQRLDQLAAGGLQPGAGPYLGTEQNQAAGSAVVGGSFPRSILIPGTETSIKFSGTAMLLRKAAATTVFL